MASMTLYHASPSRSSVTLWMLEEIGEPYDVKLLKLGDNEQNKPDYLSINPMGKVPALKVGDVVITEVAAICAYLADEFPDKKLNIPVGDPRRGLYLKWLFFAPSVIEPAANDKVFPRKEPPRAGAIGYRDLDTVLTWSRKRSGQDRTCSAINSPPRMSWSARCCAGACCSALCPSAPNSRPMSPTSARVPPPSAPPQKTRLLREISYILQQTSRSAWLHFIWC